ncbi:uncharacterized protein MELLADRAFT_89776 [Melampsora larici-populina 98AG31]|uniref:Uncharacterized protein n=1 Tax=Melampsora larici-populina (strain 98AG31 / pathotype 3-4-7) TaxID=747676 RepID=F4RUK9_MELLP|nr:uncharacterized protein MELLADRAFT_89776 [Melampsora larici-populina 98AG31]EGG03949.1 hypothetical protein MELLADRAFT_89776 [Melampsora larici-populina 98AG31]
MLGQTMLSAYEAMYGEIPFNPEANDGRQTEAPKERGRTRQRRPRTESLILDEEPVTVEMTRDQRRPPDERITVQAKSTRAPQSNPPTGPRKERKRSLPVEEDSESDALSDPEREINFVDDQELSNNHLLKLSNGLHQRMTKLQAYVPLTVFNADWIEKDVEKAGLKKVKTVKELQEGDDVPTYSGLTPKDKLLLSYGEWMDCIDLFIRYVEEFYHMERTAEMFRKHKANVIDIRRSTLCWMVALRYCIKVRKLVMQNRTKNGKRQMNNAGILHQDILRAAKDKAEVCGERSYAENPYTTTTGENKLQSSNGRPLAKNEVSTSSQDANGWKNSSKSRRNNHNSNNKRKSFDRNISYRKNWKTDYHGGGHGGASYHQTQNTGYYSNCNHHNAPYNNTFPSSSSGFHPLGPYGGNVYGSSFHPSYSQGGSMASTSKPHNQLAIVAKPSGSGQGGALAIVNRQNGGGKQNCGDAQGGWCEPGRLGKDL